jgi:hypothetical protein
MTRQAIDETFDKYIELIDLMGDSSNQLIEAMKNVNFKDI